MSEILKNWESGLGLPGVLTIDGHVHIGDWYYPFTLFNNQTIDTMAESAVKIMDANGVDAACILPTGYYTVRADYRFGNDIVLDVCKMLPERLIGFASLNPNDSEKNILTELDRVLDAGVRCIKLVNSYQQNYPGDGPNLMLVYKYASDHKMLVFNHHWSFEELTKISAEFPSVDFICGHYRVELDSILKEQNNVYANIWGYGNYGWLDRGIRMVGPEKLMFGSDAFLNPVSVGIGPVVYAPISDDDKRLILGINCAKLLDKVGVLPDSIKKMYLENKTEKS